MSFLRALQPHEVEFSVRAVEDTDEPDPKAYHNGRMDMERIKRGHLWAWCTVVVTARWNRFSGTSMLPHCCYESKEDFESGAHYDDMCMDAMNDLQNALERIANRLAPLLTQESFDEWTVETVQRG